MHVAILAPVSARSLASRFEPRSRAVAESLDGNYGAAPTALVAALLDAGVFVTVVTHRRGEPELRLSGERLVFVQVSSRSSARSQAFDAWRKERRDMASKTRLAKPDIVHAHWSYEWALAGLQSGLPLVITVRDAPLTILRYYRDTYRLLRTLLAYSVRVRAHRHMMTATSPYMARVWRREMAWFSSMPVTPNIVPIDVARVRERSKTPVIVEIADSGSRKNIKGLLRAFSLVQREVLGVRLLLVGSGLGTDGELANWAHSHGLDRGVEFVGNVGRDEVAEHLSAAWVHAHAALEESFGNTLVEAMAVGTPTIGGASSAAVPWVLDNGRAGVLTDVTDPRRFAGDMISLLRDAPARKRFSAAGLERVKTRFSSAVIAEQHLHLYASVIKVKESP